MKHWKKDIHIDEEDDLGDAHEWTITIGDLECTILMEQTDPKENVIDIHLSVYDCAKDDVMVSKSYTVRASIQSAAKKATYYAEKLYTMARKSVEADYHRRYNALSRIPLDIS